MRYQEGTGWQGPLTSFCWGKRKKVFSLKAMWLFAYGMERLVRFQHPGWLGGGWGGHCHPWSLVRVCVQIQEKSSAVSQGLLCSGGLLLYLQDGPLCGMMSCSSVALLVISSVSAVSTGQSVPGLFSARTLLIPALLQCTTYPKKLMGDFSKTV